MELLTRFVVLFFLWGLLTASPPATAAQLDAQANPGLEKVVLQLVWMHQFQFAGYYAALHKGFYQEEGLEVEIVPGGPGSHPLKEVLAGRAQYGVGKSELILQRTQGKPVVVLAAIFQHSALVFLTKKASGIRTPHDLSNKKVMLFEGNLTAELLAVLKNEGVKADIIPTSYDVNDLIAGKVDAFNAYITNEPYYLLEKGVEPQIIRPLTYGIDFYGDCLFTTDAEVRQHPERVKKFRRASLKGWQYALDHPEEIIELLLETYKVDKSREHLRYEAEQSRKLILPMLVRIGHMNPGRWQHILDTYVQLGLSRPGLSWSGFLHDPEPTPDYEWMRRLLLLTLAVIALSGLGLIIMFAFNRRLQTALAKGTQELNEANMMLEERVRKRTEELENRNRDLRAARSEAEAAEARYRQLFEQAPDAVVLADLESGKFVEFNTKAHEALGYTRQEFQRLTIPDLEAAESPEEVSAHIDKVKREGSDVFETRHRARDGEIIDVRVNARALTIDDRPRLQFIWTDISSLKSSEAAIRKLNQDLEQRQVELIAEKEKAEAANRAKSIFLANMSHELRTPLNAVLGFSKLMRNDLRATAKQRESLDIILRSGEHLLNLINNVLDISKIESGRVELEEAPYDLHQLIQEIKSSMHVRAHGKGLAFTVEQSPDLPCLVAVDGGKLRQVLFNLLGNALKYTQQGKVTLRAMATRQESGGPVGARFEVEDTGPGIRLEDRERIFAPFVQLGEKAPTEAGSGLGLAISRQYVKLMGGTIMVAGEPGKGSVFYFEIPLTMLSPETISAAPHRRRVIGVAEGQPCYRLLIAEDQPENRLLLRRVLEPLGFDLREAVNGREAVEMFTAWHPQLIWMDIRMPIMDGLEATRRIKAGAGGAQTRIVAITAHALEDERREILAAGCDDFIRKPYRFVDVFEALARNLGVQFVYEEETAPPAGAEQVDAAALAPLPPELLNTLVQALIRIDIGAVNQAVADIRTYNGSLAEALAALAKDLQFGRMLRMIRAALGKTVQEYETCIKK